MSRFGNYAFVFVILFTSACPVGVSGQESAPDSFVIPSDDKLPGVGPMRRYDWFRNLWKRRRSTFESNRQADQGSVVFLGDSITQGWGDDFHGAFPGLKKANRGISGDTTRGMLYRLNEDVLQVNPAAVVMLMGTNDLEEKATPEMVAANVREIIAALKRHKDSMPIVLCEVFPSSASKARPVEKIQEVNRLYRELAKGDAQITVVDTWTLFANADGDAKKEEFPDLLHPNQVGYDKWEKAIHPVFATLELVETQADDFAVEAGATSLFNGKDLTGWGYRRTTDQMRNARKRWLDRSPGVVVWPVVDEPVDFASTESTPDGRYRAIHGRLVVTTPPEGRKIQQLWTNQEYNGDFKLVLEFRATPNADSGVFIRGKQLQCRDFPLAGPYKELKTFRSGDWNEMVISVSGTKAHCTCNGEVIEEAMDVPASGPIGLEGDRGQMEYRRIRIFQ